VCVVCGRLFGWAYWDFPWVFFRDNTRTTRTRCLFSFWPVPALALFFSLGMILSRLSAALTTY
jgi:hypothetical protein